MRHVVRRTAFPDFELKSFDLLGVGRLFSLRKTADGVSPAFGTEELQVENIPSAAQAVYLTSHGNFYMYNSGDLWRSTGAYGNFYRIGTGFTSPPYFAECCDGDEDFTIIGDGQKALRSDYTLTEGTTCPPIKLGVGCYSRIFGVDSSDSHVLRWSAAGDVTDWEESAAGAGHVRLDPVGGDIVRLVPLGGDLIAVRSHGIAKITAGGEGEDFKVEYACGDFGEVIENAVVCCADKIYFFAKDGLYCFDGNVKKADFDGLEGFSEVTCAAACGNRIFAGGKLDGQYAIACIGTDGGGVSYVARRADCICAVGRVFFYDGTAPAELVPSAEEGEWKSGETDFGVHGKKFLHSIVADGNLTSLTVSDGTYSRTFSDVNGEIKVGMAGEKFSFDFLCEGEVKALSARYVSRR